MRPGELERFALPDERRLHIFRLSRKMTDTRRTTPCKDVLDCGNSDQINTLDGKDVPAQVILKHMTVISRGILLPSLGPQEKPRI